MPKSRKKPEFEKSLARLEEIVAQLEEGELSLEQSLQVFEEGVALTRQCQTALQEAEQTVKLLTDKAGQPVLKEMDLEVDTEAGNSAGQYTDE